MEPSPGLFHNARVRISLVIALAIVVVAYFTSRPETTKTFLAETPKDTVRTGIDLDEDRDGLVLWQEELWGTDSKNPDSDGDGATDGDEVRAGRDPRVAGPNDKIGSMALATSTKRFYDDDPSLSTTDVIARDALSAVFAMKQSGAPSDADLADLADQLVAKASTHMTPGTPRYTRADVKTVSLPNADAYRVYANALESVFAAYRDASKESELLTFQRAIDTEDNALLASLEKYQVSYANIAKILVAIEVPDDLLDAHLGLANAYLGLSDSIGHLVRFTEDPVIHVGGVKLYADSSAEVQKTMELIRMRITSSGAIFTSSDPGANLFAIPVGISGP